MKISKSTSYDIKFKVEYFEPQEGGMDNEQFGDTVDTLEEALHLLDLAKAQQTHPKDLSEWIITCEVKRSFNK